MKQRRFLLSLLLILCMLFQPIVPVFARLDEGGGFNNGKADIGDAKTKFNEAYEKIMGLDPIEMDGGTTAAVAVGSFLNDPLGCIGNALGADTGYEDYVAKIKEANEKIAEAQQLATDMKTQFDGGNFDKSSKIDANQLANGAIAAQQKVNTECQQALKDTGDMLVKVGGILETITTVLGILGPICDILSVVAAVPPFTGVAAVAGVIGKVCDWGAIALGPMAAYMKSTGKGLIEASEAGTWSDKELFNETVHKKQLEETAPAVAGSVFSVVMKTNGAKNLVNKSIEKAGASSIAQKFLGENSTSVIKAAWDPNSLKASVLQDSFGRYIPDYVSAKDATKIFNSAASALSNSDAALFKAATGESQAPLGGKAILKKAIKDGTKGATTYYTNTNDKSANDTPGLNVEHGGSGGTW